MRDVGPNRPSGRSSDAASALPRGPWVELPLGRRPRYTIAVSSRRSADEGLRLYQPVTYSGLGLWVSARVVAATGLLRLIGKAQLPPTAEALAAHIPRGGTLSVTISRRRDRALALLLDPADHPVGVAKVAFDDRGREKLANEVAGLRRAAERLRPPLAAPAVIAHEPGILVLEAVAWRVRLRPWILPIDVATAMGHLHRDGAGTAAASGGFGHGDFAPWNLLRTGDGWCLLDWEESSDAAPVFEDPLHYLVQSHALLGRPSRDDLLAGLRGAGWVGASLEAYARAAHADRAQLPSAFTSYLDRSRARLRPDRPDERRGIAARDRLLAAFTTLG